MVPLSCYCLLIMGPAPMREDRRVGRPEHVLEPAQLASAARESAMALLGAILLESPEPQICYADSGGVWRVAAGEKRWRSSRRRPIIRRNTANPNDGSWKYSCFALASLSSYTSQSVRQTAVAIRFRSGAKIPISPINSPARDEIPSSPISSVPSLI